MEGIESPVFLRSRDIDKCAICGCPPPSIELIHFTGDPTQNNTHALRLPHATIKASPSGCFHIDTRLRWDYHCEKMEAKTKKRFSALFYRLQLGIIDVGHRAGDLESADSDLSGQWMVRPESDSVRMLGMARQANTNITSRGKNIIAAIRKI